MSGFCHFGLVFFMVLWQSPDTPDMSCFHVSVLEPCALSSACLVLCSDPGTRVLRFGFVSGFRHSRSVFCLVVWACGLECARPCALLSMQFVFYRCDCYQFTIAVTLCRVLSCPAKPCCQSSFPYGVFCLFVLEIKPITLQYWVLASSLYPNPDMWVCYYFHYDAK